MTGAAPLLSVRRLTIEYPVRRRWPWEPEVAVRAVTDVHFNLHEGETLGIVGESGSGKSTLARALLGLQPARTGGIVFEKQDLARLGEEAWRPLRRHIQMVFQDPYSSLDPRYTALQSVEEPLEALCPEIDASARRARALEMLARVGLSGLEERYPHELSGGQCQRVGIARAVALRPRILVCDEPVSALDAQAQRQIVELLTELQREYGLSMVFISHDLPVVRRLAQRVLVMYLGRIMEQAPTAALFSQPRHPYTRALLASAPRLEPRAPMGRPVVPFGDLPDAAHPPSGCVFRTRCPMADDLCAREAPYLRRAAEQSHAACHYLHSADTDGPALREGIVGPARRVRRTATEA